MVAAAGQSQPVVGRIVIYVDRTAESRAALWWGLRTAEQRRASVLLVHAFGTSVHRRTTGLRPRLRWRSSATNARDLLVELADAARVEHPDLVVQTVAVDKGPAPALVAASRGADLLVVGCHRPAGTAVAAVDPWVLRMATHAVCTVVVVPDPGESPQGRGTVVGVDAAAHGDHALAHAFEEADRYGEPLLALHAWHERVTDALAAAALPVPFDVVAHHEGRDRALAMRLQPWQDRYPDVAVTRRIVQDRPSRALAMASSGARLLVVGSRVRGHEQLLGTVSRGVLHSAACPVAVVREPQPASTTPRYPALV